MEIELDFEKAENWLKHSNLYPQIQTHASGHLCYDEIREAIETVQPHTVIPIHTVNPHVFKNIRDNVVIAEKNQQLSL
jgi:ribonuclease J